MKRQVTVVVAVEFGGRGEDQIAKSFVYDGVLTGSTAIKRARDVMIDWVLADSRKEEPLTSRAAASEMVNEFYNFMYSITEIDL